jgi:hypothetical protein
MDSKVTNVGTKVAEVTGESWLVEVVKDPVAMFIVAFLFIVALGLFNASLSPELIAAISAFIIAVLSKIPVQ